MCNTNSTSADESFQVLIAEVISCPTADDYHLAMRNELTNKSGVTKRKSKVIKESGITEESGVTGSALLVKKDIVLNTGQEISILFWHGKAACFRQSKSSSWEPIGDENWSLAMAMNQLEEEVKSRE